jgi:hypothetical protein
MGDGQNDDLADVNVKYDAPVPDAQAHRRVAFNRLIWFRRASGSRAS